MSSEPQIILKEYIARHGLKQSRQRDVIAEVFFKAGGHLKIEELLQRARLVDTKVSQATVYRTMKLLTECGLAAAHTSKPAPTERAINIEVFFIKLNDRWAV